MSAENRALVRRVIDDLMNKKNPALIDEFYSTDYHGDTPDGTFQGRDGIRALYNSYASAFPDFHLKIEDMVAEDDKMVTYYTFTGTNTGPVGAAPPTGKSVSVKGVIIARLIHGKIADERFVWDSLALMTQLGLVNAGSHGTGATA